MAPTSTVNFAATSTLRWRFPSWTTCGRPVPGRMAKAGDPQVAVALAAYATSLIDYAVECVDWLLPLQQQVEGGAVDPAVEARYWGALAAPT